MSENILQNYIEAISSKYSHQETSEMGYRTDFEILLKGIFESIKVTRFDHDPKAKGGNKPDFVVVKDDVPLLYIEAKDIGVSLDKIEKSEQMSRYYGYANLILTDYVEFRFYRNGLPYGEPIKIAKYDKASRAITSEPANFEYLSKTLIDFTKSYKEPIKSGKHLAKIMGGKAQRIRDNIRQFLATESEKNSELKKVFDTFKKLLVHDLTVESFSDMYAQTLVYGLFVARYHDKSTSTFTRQEARDLIPASNPLLRHFFDHIVGPDFDPRLEHIVNELCEVFSHAHVEDLMSQYFTKETYTELRKGPDPVIHFYEDFLKEYDPELRKKMGAFYTPLPVVQFIVRSVDYLLKTEFNLPGGLADTSKLDNGMHKVQILDPAVGTGTFISNIIGHIYKGFKETGQLGRWPAYVQKDLLSRLHGFEIMMASYTIAHLKLSIALKETGFKYFNSRRLGIYLTNSLEETPTQENLFAGFGFAESISEEAKEATKIKNKTPIMVVVGNPPYSGESTNKSSWIMSLMEDYKHEPDTDMRLNERNPKWINDDYVKFLRFAQYFIEKNNSGIVAFINPHGFLDNPTFRGMRWSLLKSYDKIYILDLHGNAKKKEVSPDGSKDENVFDIQQGVSINIFVKTTGKSEGKLGKIYHEDLWGKREEKFDFLTKNNIKDVIFKKIPTVGPGYFMVKKDLELADEYNKGFSVKELFPVSSVGIVTAKDTILIGDSIEDVRGKIEDYFKIIPDDNLIEAISYRPFDDKYIYYDTRLVERAREGVMKHFRNKQNIGLVVKRQGKFDFSYVFVTNTLAEGCLFESAYANNTICPLYLYSDDGARELNLSKGIRDQVESKVGEFDPEDLFDYIYAVLQSPEYREKYNQFLKMDFPRVPYPSNKEIFRKLAERGRELRALHLFESPKLDRFITIYPEAGSDIVEKIEQEDGNVYINPTQYFGNVPEIAWNFWIGGYQPAQKWLKDRKGRQLKNEDIEHYQKMISALVETDRIMREIDEIIKYDNPKDDNL